MFPSILTDSAQQIALAVLIGAVVFLAIVHIFDLRLSLRTRARRWNGQASVADLKNAGQQLQAVMTASYTKRKIMNPGEYRAFKAIEGVVAAAGSGHRVFAQTSLGEVLASPQRNGFSAINSKRVDILVVDQDGWPVLAIEYQGSGHYQGTAAARDAVKREALRRAGVRYMEVMEGDSTEQVCQRLREHLGWHDASSPGGVVVKIDGARPKALGR